MTTRPWLLSARSEARRRVPGGERCGGVISSAPSSCDDEALLTSIPANDDEEDEDEEGEDSDVEEVTFLVGKAMLFLDNYN